MEEKYLIKAVTEDLYLSCEGEWTKYDYLTKISDSEKEALDFASKNIDFGQSFIILKTFTKWRL